MLIHSLIAAAKSNPAPSVTINVAWLVIGGFAAAFGAALWKFMPWAIKRALDEKIDNKLVPMMNDVHSAMNDVHERIDSHMNTEEDSFVILSDKVQAVTNQIDAQSEERTDLKTKVVEFLDELNELGDKFDSANETLERHMHADESQFALSADALVAGQTMLLSRLEQIEKNTTPRELDPESGESFT